MKARENEAKKNKKKHIGRMEYKEGREKKVWWVNMLKVYDNTWKKLSW